MNEKGIQVVVNTSASTLTARLRSEFVMLEGGARLPTIRDIAGRYGVSQFAVQRAFGKLQGEGLIQSFVGRGSFVAGGEQDTTEQVGVDRPARVLIVSHSTPSLRGFKITHAVQEGLLNAGKKVICVSYNDVGEFRDLLGDGGFDICVLQPRRSILPVEVLALLKSKARHMIVEGRELERLNIDVFVRNRAKSIAIALKHLRELGHTNVGLLTERLDVAAGYAEIENLFTQNYCSSPNNPEAQIVRVAGVQDAEITKALENDLSDCAMLPSAFIISGRFAVAAVKEGFERAGFNIPDDVSVVHLRADLDDGGDAGEFTTIGRTIDHVVSGMLALINWRLANPNEPAAWSWMIPVCLSASLHALAGQDDENEGVSRIDRIASDDSFRRTNERRALNSIQQVAAAKGEGEHIPLRNLGPFCYGRKRFIWSKHCRQYFPGSSTRRNTGACRGKRKRQIDNLPCRSWLAGRRPVGIRRHSTCPHSHVRKQEVSHRSEAAKRQ